MSVVYSLRIDAFSASNSRNNVSTGTVRPLPWSLSRSAGAVANR